MATVVRDIPYHDRRIAERRRIAYPAALRADGVRVSWGGVFGGVLVALGFLLLMTALGVAVGISAAQPGETDTGTLGAGAGIWAGVSLLVALFIGGWVSTRIGAIFDGTTGFFEGVLVALGFLLLMTALGVAVGISAAQPGETDTGTLGAGAGIWAGVSLLVALFIGGWVSTRIGAIFDGTTGFFEGALVWVVSVLLMLYMASSGIGMLADGAFGLVGGAAKALGQGETAQRIENNRGNPAQQAADAKNGVAQLIEKAGGARQQKAEEGKPGATRAAWITFGALLLSLLAAALGAVAGRRNPGKERSEERRVGKKGRNRGAPYY